MFQYSSLLNLFWLFLEFFFPNIRPFIAFSQVTISLFCALVKNHFLQTYENRYYACIKQLSFNFYIYLFVFHYFLEAPTPLPSITDASFDFCYITKINGFAIILMYDKQIIFSFTLYSSVSSGNLDLRDSVPHFSRFSRRYMLGFTCWGLNVEWRNSTPRLALWWTDRRN